MKKIALVASVIAAASTLALSGCATAPHPGTNTAASQPALPASFPTRDVPLVKGRIIVARGNADDGWSVTVMPTGSTFSDAEKRLTDAGYRVTHPGTLSATLADSQYIVFLQTPGKAISYQVTAVGS